MKYLLFAFDNYYPNGGINDFQGSFETVEEAQQFYKKGHNTSGEKYDWYQIVTWDGNNFTKVESNMVNRKKRN